MPGLSQTQLAAFKEEGYLLLEELLPEAAYHPLVEELNAVIDQKARKLQRERENGLFMRFLLKII